MSASSSSSPATSPHQVAIRAWIAERLRLGKNTLGDEQIREAFECATLMELERAEVEFTRREQRVCECGLRQRSWNPNTHRCETCGARFEDRREGSTSRSKEPSAS